MDKSKKTEAQAQVNDKTTKTEGEVDARLDYRPTQRELDGTHPSNNWVGGGACLTHPNNLRRRRW